jgi:hypothetical protein
VEVAFAIHKILLNALLILPSSFRSGAKEARPLASPTADHY